MPDWLVGVIIFSFSFNLLIFGATAALLIEHHWIKKRRSFWAGEDTFQQ